MGTTDLDHAPRIKCQIVSNLIQLYSVNMGVDFCGYFPGN